MAVGAREGFGSRCNGLLTPRYRPSRRQ